MAAFPCSRAWRTGPRAGRGRKKKTPPKNPGQGAPIRQSYTTFIFSPPGLEGVHLPTFCLGGTFNSFLLKSNQNLQTSLLYQKKQKNESKINKKNNVCQCWGPQNVGKRPLLSKFVFGNIFLHISFGLPGTLQKAFELKIALPTAKKSAGCDCANGKCY